MKSAVTPLRVLDAFFQNSLSPVVFLDRDFGYLRVNEAYAEACGKQVGDFPGRNHFELYPHAENEGIFRRVVATKTPHRAAAEPFEFPGRPGKGKTYWDWTLIPLLNSAGEVDALVFSLEDVGERVRGVEELKGHAAELDKIYNKAPCGYHLLAEDGPYLRVNDTELAWLGCRREELIGRKKFTDLLTPAGVKTFSGEFPVFKERGSMRDLEFDMVRKDGSILPVLLSATAAKDESGRFVMSLTTIYDMTDRKRAEEARARLAAMVEGSADAIIGKTLDGVILSWNEGAHKLYGWTAAEAVGERMEMLLPPGEPDELPEILSKIRRGEHLAPYETNRRSKDGRVMRVSLTVSPVKDPSGAVVGASSAARDVTQRWEAERAVAKLTRALRALSLCNETLVRAKKESEFLERVCRLIVEQGGYRLAWVGFRIDDAVKSVHPAAQAGYEKGYLEGLTLTWANDERGRGPTGNAIRNGTVDICRDVRADPRFAPWREDALKRGYRSSVALPLQFDGRPFGALMIYAAEPGAFDGEEMALLKELSEDLAFGISTLRSSAARELAEEALSRTEARYRLLFEAAKDGILVVDAATGEIQDANLALLVLVGYSKAECIGRRLWDFAPFKAAAADNPALRELASRGDTRDENLILRAKDGREISVEFAANSYAVDGGRVVQCSVRDMTERSRLQEQMLHAQKMESIGLLAGGIAHDFNNILMAILGNCSFLLASLAPNDPRRADVEEIRMAEERAVALTRQLLLFSRKEKARPVVLDLNMLIRNLQKMLGRILGEDFKFETALCPEPVTMLADPGQLEQVIMNLAVNARDAMRRGGRLSLRTSRRGPGETRHRDCAAGEKGFVRLELEDTGSGMTPEVRAHLFEPFFTTKPVGKGTGLGLSTVYGIVRQSGGGISARSAPGQGTTFTIDFPLIEAAAAAAPTQAPAAKAEAAGRETILLVEDDEILRRIDLRILLERGYRVLPARDGEEALALLHDGGQNADLLLTDVVMPGISGGELAREALKLKPGLKVIFVSGYAGHGETEQLQATKHMFLQKPVAPDVLAEKVREVLDRNAAV